jgi:hypothetical protein
VPRPHLTLRVRVGAVMFDCGPCETSAGVRPVVAFGGTHIAWLAGARGPWAHAYVRMRTQTTKDDASTVLYGMRQHRHAIFQFGAQSDSGRS